MIGDCHGHPCAVAFSKKNYMEAANEGDCFHLPTGMHLHAFMLLNDERFANKHFKVEVNE